MRTFHSARLLRFLLLSVFLFLCVAVLYAAAEGSDTVPVSTPYFFDFSDADVVFRSGGTHNVSVLQNDGALSVRFADGGGNVCEDPYFDLPIPDQLELSEYPYAAILLRTDMHTAHGELRFRTDRTGDGYPCQFYEYEKTDGWQVVTVDLTDNGTVRYVDVLLPLTGKLCNLRIDPFDNSCPAGTLFEIRAYGFYKTEEDARSIVYVSTDAQATDKEEQKEDTSMADFDYSPFWRGTDFDTPALRTHMRWLSYGFSDASPIDRYLDEGWGGVISNVNFNSRYLQDDSEFSRLADVYTYAAGKGMALWLYDEYQWPSGKAFGLVLDGHDELEATGVEHRRYKGTDGNASCEKAGTDIRILRADLTDGTGTRTLESPAFPLSVPAEGDWTLDVYVLRRTYEGVENRTDFSTLRDVDLLNPETTARFLSLTHEQYRDKMGAAFDLVEAFFTDEPQLGNRGRTHYAVWTDGLDEKFRETYGYDLNLPSIFFGSTDFDRTCRMHYYQLVSSLFRISYFDQISDWCEENGTASSGHLLFEENMNDHVDTYGGDFMQTVGAMTIPGVDLLWVDPGHLMSRNFIGNYMGMRYVASAAKHAGKTDVMVEFNPDAVSALSKTDPLADCIGGASVTRLFGTTIYNVINPQKNLTASQSNQLNTYIGRINTLLDGAVEAGNVAVFYPIATVQALHDADSAHGSDLGNDNDAAFLLDTQYQSLCKSLLNAQILFSAADDESIRDAVISDDGCLCMGLGAYRAVVIPYTRYISVEALEKLSAFEKAGGCVLFYNNIPLHGLFTGQEDTISALVKGFAHAEPLGTAKSLISALKDAAPSFYRAETDGSASDLLMGDFETEDKDITYLVNIGSGEHTVTLTAAEASSSPASVYYPLTGMIEAVPAGDSLTLTVQRNEAVLVVRNSDNSHLAAHAALTAVKQTENDVPSDGNPAAVRSGKTALLCAAGAAAAALALVSAAVVFLQKKKRR